MIEEFSIKNYRQHENLLIKFDPHFNIISGDNLNGKTNIFRALRSLLFLTPISENDLPRNKDVKEIHLQCTFSDGSKLSRLYTKSKQLITYVDSTGKDFNYTSLSLAIQEVPKLVKFNYLHYGNNKLNLNFYEARQSLLLVHNTSTELYKLLSAFYGFETFALSLNKCNSDLNTSTKNITIYSNALSDLKSKLTNLNDTKVELSNQLKVKKEFLLNTKTVLENIENLKNLQMSISSFIQSQISDKKDTIHKLYQLLSGVDNCKVIPKIAIDEEACYCPTCGKKID